MVAIVIDGFDKYGTSVANLTLGEWTTQNAASSFVSGAYSSGALRCGGGAFGASVNRTLPSSYSTLVAGVRIRSDLLNVHGFTFSDGGTNQMSICINTLGKWEVRRGSVGGTILFTSGSSVTASTWHYVETKITFNTTTGQYALWIDGVNLVTSAANQNTAPSGIASANNFGLVAGSNRTVDFDDLYIFDNTGAFNNNVVGDSVVETQYPNGDSSVQFAIGAAALGAYYSADGSTSVAAFAQYIFLRTYTPSANATLNSISWVPKDTSGGGKVTGLCFADSAGVPGTLLSATTEQIGITANVAVTLNLISPQSLTAGTPIWIGIMQNTTVGSYKENSTTNLGYVANYTYTLGAPASAPVMTGGQPSWSIWGNVTSSANFTEVENLDGVPDSSLRNYLSSDVVGDEDLYTFPNLSSIPISVSAVKVSAFCQKSDAGGRQLDLRVKSNLMDDGGNNTNQPMSGTFEYLSSIFDNDPDSGLQWDATSVNNALSGIKVSG